MISKCIDAYASFILLIHFKHISAIIEMDAKAKDVSWIWKEFSEKMKLKKITKKGKKFHHCCNDVAAVLVPL